MYHTFLMVTPQWCVPDLRQAEGKPRHDGARAEVPKLTGTQQRVIARLMESHGDDTEVHPPQCSSFVWDESNPLDLPQQKNPFWQSRLCCIILSVCDSQQCLS